MRTSPHEDHTIGFFLATFERRDGGTAEAPPLPLPEATGPPKRKKRRKHRNPNADEDEDLY